MILVISDTDNYICFGKVIEPSYEIINDFTLKYDNKLYNKAVTDYQRIARIEFGDENIVEGELEYTDYESEDGKKVLSLTNDHKSDTLLDIIKLEDIVI